MRVPRFSLPTSLALVLLLPAPAAAWQQAPAGETLAPAEESALDDLSAAHATEYPLIDSWFEGRPIQYYHFGASVVDAGSLYRVQGGNELVNTIPGLDRYGAVRQVFDVEILPGAGVAPGAVRSHYALLELVRAGKARLAAAGLTVNLPIVPAGSTLERDPIHRPLRSAWYRSREVWYFDFGANPPGAIPLIAFGAAFPAAGESLEPVEGQPSNASAIPGMPVYSDLWDIQVAVGRGYAPGSYRDFRKARADARAGRLTIRPRGVVFNCPVVYVNGAPASRSHPAFGAGAASDAETGR